MRASRGNIIGQLIPCIEDKVREGALNEIWTISWEGMGELMRITNKGLVLISGSWDNIIICLIMLA